MLGDTSSSVAAHLQTLHADSETYEYAPLPEIYQLLNITAV